MCFVPPPGVRVIPDADADNDIDFVAAGWTRHRLVPTNTQERVCNLLNGQRVLLVRCQYPARPFVAATVHKSMGDTLLKLASTISIDDKSTSLWLKAQLYVLASRVRSLSDIIFVGPKEQTLAAIRDVCQKTTQWDKYIHHLLETTASTVPVTFNQPSVHIFRPWHVPIPASTGRFCYLICSVKDCTQFMIGSTSNLRQTLFEFNTGRVSTHSNLLPWALAGFICGFTIDSEQTEFEHLWRNHINEHYYALLLIPTLTDVFQCAENIIQSDLFLGMGYRAVICGDINVQ